MGYTSLPQAIIFKKNLEMLNNQYFIILTNTFVHTKSVQKLPSYRLWKMKTFIDEDTRYKIEQ